MSTGVGAYIGTRMLTEAGRKEVRWLPTGETRRQEEARLAREAIERNARDAEALERPNRRKS